MNIQMFGETAEEKTKRILDKHKTMLVAVNTANAAITDVIQTAPPGATVEELNTAVQERLNPSKPPYVTYAALVVGAYLLFK